MQKRSSNLFARRLLPEYFYDAVFSRTVLFARERVTKCPNNLT